jgi:hypothetical protein
VLTTVLWLVGATVAVAVTLVWVRWCIRHPDLATVVVLGLACFSAHVLALLYQGGVPAGVVRDLIPVKDVAAVLLLGTLLHREARDDHLPRWFIAMGVLLLAAGLPGIVIGLHSAGLGDLALSVRNAAVPFIAGLTGLLLRPDERRRVATVGVPIVATAAVASLVEYALPLSFVRDTVGVGEYWADVKRQMYHLDPDGSGLPGNFFTSDGVRRLSGPFGDPLSAGYALAVTLVVLVLSDRSRRTVPLATLLGVSLLLTFTRGGWIIAAGGLAPVAVVLLLRQPRRRQTLLLAGAAVAGAVVAALPPMNGYLTTLFSGRDDSTRGHLNAILHSRGYSYSALGNGWGSSGGAVGKGTESVFVTLALQVGLVGVALYVAALIVLVVVVRRRWVGIGLGLPFAGLVVAIVVTMLVSEQLFTFNAGWVVVALIAIAPQRRLPFLAPSVHARMTER